MVKVSGLDSKTLQRSGLESGRARRRSGSQTAVISLIESSRANSTLSVVDALAAALGVSVADLFEPND